MSTFQAVVLSGGGAKGPFGLGVLLALAKFRKEREKDITPIYCGTSVGALNAAMAAQGSLRELNELYARLRTDDVLGTSNSSVGPITLGLTSFRKPYHYFKNDALRATIAANVKFEALANSHLLVCVTNLITGRLETFYKSTIVEELIAKESELEPTERRLNHYHPIQSQEELIDVLLASAAIPFYFSPVEILGQKYVDGGVGNNTPLRQAAYVSRYLHSCSVHVLPTVCVINDPQRFSIESDTGMDVFGVIRRSLDIFHNELVQDSLNTWHRINASVRASQDQERRISSILNTLPVELREPITTQVFDVLRDVPGVAAKMELPLYDIRPSSPLLDDVLKFDPKNAKRLKHQGVEDCLKMLVQRSDITHGDYQRWVEEID